MSPFAVVVVAVCGLFADVSAAGNKTYTVHISREDSGLRSLERFETENPERLPTASISTKAPFLGMEATGRRRLPQSPPFPAVEETVDASKDRKKVSENRTIVTREISEEDKMFDRQERTFLSRLNKRFQKRGQGTVYHEFTYDGNPTANNGPPLRSGPEEPTFKYFPGERSMVDYSGERFFYNDAPWRADGEARGARLLEPAAGPTLRRPILERNSCKQYLEFLRYAFEQINNPQADDYYYYDGDYDYHQWDRRLPSTNHVTKVAPQIAPDMDLLRTIAYEGENGTKNEAVTSTTTTATPSVVWATVSTEAATTTTTTAAETTMHVATDVAVARSGVRPNGTRAYHVGTALGSTTREPRDRDDVTGSGCHKMFPCPDNVNVTYPVNGYCNSFIVCESGKSSPEFCPEGLHFNIITKRCDLPHNSFCTYSCPRANGYFGIPGDCAGFFRCLNWYPEYRLCPPRMHWDHKAKICTFEELSACPLKCEAPYQVKPYNGVCNAYVICTRGVGQYHKCPLRTHFDRTTLKCVDKSQSSCVMDEDFIGRNRGIENGRGKLCADVQLVDGKTRWCQEPSAMDE